MLKYGSGYPDPKNPLSDLNAKEVLDLATRLRAKCAKHADRISALEPIAESHAVILSLLRQADTLREDVGRRDRLIDSLLWLISSILEGFEDDGPDYVGLWVLSQLHQEGSGDAWWEKLNEDLRYSAANQWRFLQEELQAAYPRGSRVKTEG